MNPYVSYCCSEVPFSKAGLYLDYIHGPLAATYIGAAVTFHCMRGEVIQHVQLSNNRKNSCVLGRPALTRCCGEENTVNV